MRCKAYVLESLKKKPAQHRFRNLDWAHNILTRQAKGENVTPHALECAREVTGFVQRMREPGEDLEEMSDATR